jgi:hypothetical protein
MSKEDVHIIDKYKEKKLYALRGCNYASEFLSIDALLLHAEESLLLAKMIKPLKNIRAVLTAVDSNQSMQWDTIISSFSIKFKLNMVQNAYLIYSFHLDVQDTRRNGIYVAWKSISYQTDSWRVRCWKIVQAF